MWQHTQQANGPITYALVCITSTRAKIASINAVIWEKSPSLCNGAMAVHVIAEIYLILLLWQVRAARGSIMHFMVTITLSISIDNKPLQNVSSSSAPNDPLLGLNIE
jgi:hypothetical protein